MHRISIIIFTFILFLISPLKGAEQKENPDFVSYKGLRREHVFLALWVNASGSSCASYAKIYLATSTAPCPTVEDAEKFLNGPRNSGGYFYCRKVFDTFQENETYYCRSYNLAHGPNRAQVVIEALRSLSEKGPITHVGISKLYVSVWTTIFDQECKQKQALIDAGKFQEALNQHEGFSTRQDADCVGTTLAMDVSGDQVAAVKEFATGMAAHHFGMRNDSQPKKKSASAPPPTPASTPPKTSPTQERKAPRATLSQKFESDMKGGLQKMFGGESKNTPKKDTPKKK